MILILGSTQDILVNAVSRSLQAQVVPLHYLDEEALFTRVALSLKRTDQDVNGFIEVAGNLVALEDISGILVRLPRQWWPSSDFDLQDQMFTYHETVATWFNLLSSLTCPVVNRFGLGWWLQDATYPQILGKHLSSILHLNQSVCSAFATRLGRFLPTPAPTSAEIASFYMVGKYVVGRSNRGNDGDIDDSGNHERGGSGQNGGHAIIRSIRSLLMEKAQDLARWRDETGVRLCRLDFDCTAGLTLVHVEAFPLLDGEPEDITTQLASATAELLH
jgi:hypothetical protein